MRIRLIKRRSAVVVAAAILFTTVAAQNPPTVDGEMIAKIREEGLQRSQVMEYASFISDVLGARFTMSDDMFRAQTWAMGEMREMGLVGVTAEPFMDYGTRWDNEYVSAHMVEPDYQPMVAYPLSHTPSTDGKVTSRAVIVDIRTRADLERYRGQLAGMAVLDTPPVTIDLERLRAGAPRRTAEELQVIAESIPPAPPTTTVQPRQPAGANPDAVNAVERMAFYKSEGVSVVLQSPSGWIGAVRGFARPGTRADGWGRDETLASPSIVVVTPEHYNRMYRIVRRDIDVVVEVEVRNRVGETVEQATNVLGEIAGSDLSDEVVMIGAHLDTWHASPNASDNTSGVSVVLEAMRILKAVGAQPRRTIRAALWTGEEQGIHGSREYVLKHFGDPNRPGGTTADYEKFSAYFNQDYGPGQYRGIYLQGNEHVRQTFAAWMEPFRDLGMTTISLLGVGSTDHVSFDRVGLPGFQFLQDRVPGTGGHTNLDFFDTLPAEDLMKNATIMAAFAYQAAIADERIPRKGR